MHSGEHGMKFVVHWVLQDHLPPHPFAQALQDFLQRATQPRQDLWHFLVQASSPGSGVRQTSSSIKPQGSSDSSVAGDVVGAESAFPELVAVGVAAAGAASVLGSGLAEGVEAGGSEAGAEAGLGSAGWLAAVPAPQPLDATNPALTNANDMMRFL